MQQEGTSSWFQLPPSASHHRDRYPTHAHPQQRFIARVMLKLSLRPWKHAEVLFSCLFTVGYEVQSPVCFSLGSDIWKDMRGTQQIAPPAGQKTETPVVCKSPGRNLWPCVTMTWPPLRQTGSFNIFYFCLHLIGQWVLSLLRLISRSLQMFSVNSLSLSLTRELALYLWTSKRRCLQLSAAASLNTWWGLPDEKKKINKLNNTFYFPVEHMQPSVSWLFLQLKWKTTVEHMLRAC